MATRKTNTKRAGMAKGVAARKGAAGTGARPNARQAKAGGPAKAGLQVLISYESYDGPKQMACELVDMNADEWVAVRAAGVQRMWIPRSRIFSIVERMREDDEVLSEAASAVAGQDARTGAASARATSVASAGEPDPAV